MHRLLSMLAAASLLWRGGAATASRRPPLACQSPGVGSVVRCVLSSSKRHTDVTTVAFVQGRQHQASHNHIGRRAFLRNRGPVIATAFSEYSSTTAASVVAEDVEKKPIPIVLLAGFLGSGKTSTLKHLLENNVDVRIGTIVNDVASVNIDAKLVSNVIGNINNNDQSGDGDGDESSYSDGGIVELQNGCACCSLADELLTSVVKLTDSGRRELDAIVVELSGLADPMSVRDNWEQARLQGHPATRLATLERTVTLVDACTFGTDWMSWDSAMDRSEWTEDGEDDGGLVHGGSRKVPELLAEQVEAADLLLVNKVDMADPKEVVVAAEVARGLLREASKGNVMEVTFGRVGVADLLGGKIMGLEVEGGRDAKKEDDHDGHSQGHEHDDNEKSACLEPGCTDASHSHTHEHASSVEDPSHSHEHTSSASQCDDPVCEDPTHDHSHSSHEHATSTEIATNHLGITSFVYRAPVPFNSQRLLTLLNQWPVPIKDSLDFGLVVGLGNNEGILDVDTPEDNRAFVGVLRSKGFCWMAPTHWSDTQGGTGQDAWRHDTAMYWSHAGKHFGISTAGKWWASLGKDGMKPYFVNNFGEYDRILREDWASEEWGDRRQELVFIGTKLDEGVIRVALDRCLCTEEEMVDYRAQLMRYLATNPVVGVNSFI